MELKTKYEQLRDDLRASNLECGHIIEALDVEFTMATERYKSDQSCKLYLGLLINLEIMSQGSIGTWNGSMSVSQTDIEKIQRVLTEKVELRDHQFAHICYLIQRLGYSTREALWQFVTLASALVPIGLGVDVY